MPRQRTPTNVLDLRGAFKEHPNRARPAEPKAEGELGPAPDYLDDEHRTAWVELIAIMPAGVGKSADRPAFEALVRYRVMQRNGLLLAPPLVAQFRLLLGAFAMTPADRSKVSVPAAPAENPFGALRKPAAR